MEGLIPPKGVLFFAERNERTPARTFASNAFDPLDKANIIFIHPAQGRRDIFRRVDLVVSPWNRFGSAILGWTGSTVFERDLRRFANTKGMRFDSGGLIRLDNWEEIETVSEQDVFDRLGLAFIRTFHCRILYPPWN